MDDNSFGPINLGMLQEPKTPEEARIRERVREQTAQALAEIDAEWAAIPWYKKILIGLFPSLYPEWR